MPEMDSSKPMVLMLDRKFTTTQLRRPENKLYAADLVHCLRIFKKWGYDVIWVDEGADMYAGNTRTGAGRSRS